jgi:intracellular sulfur oxidation DsrE/DsrF family protein
MFILPLVKLVRTLFSTVQHMIFSKKLFWVWWAGCLALATGALAQAPVFPRIEHYGEAYPIPESVDNPDPTLKYHVVVDIKTNDKPEEANQPLLRVARLLNLLEMSKVPRENVKIVCVVHHAAAFIAMDDRRYEEKYKVPNPNSPIFAELAQAGVQLLVCGQSLRAREIDAKKLHETVKPALSAITVVTTYQLKGYALLPL